MSTSTGIYMSDEERAALVEIARALGCLSTRGRSPGEPSIRVLMGQIAGGELVVKRPVGRPATKPKSASDRVRAEAARDPGAGPAEIARRADCSISLASRIMKTARPRAR